MPELGLLTLTFKLEFCGQSGYSMITQLYFDLQWWYLLHTFSYNRKRTNIEFLGQKVKLGILQIMKFLFFPCNKSVTFWPTMMILHILVSCQWPKTGPYWASGQCQTWVVNFLWFWVTTSASVCLLMHLCAITHMTEIAQTVMQSNKQINKQAYNHDTLHMQWNPLSVILDTVIIWLMS